MNKVVFTDERGTLSDAPESQLFKYWSFPVLHVTKAQMADIARENGFYDLLVQRWFCHRPVLRKPCGRCHPCKLANRDGVRFAHPVVVSAERILRRARSVLR
jgi:7-cyano-7-deazaguanine synthase